METVTSVCKRGHDRTAPGALSSSGDCRECARIRSRERWRNNKEAISAQRAKRHMEHPEISRARRAAYYAKHKEQELAKGREWKARNRERVVEQRIKYYAATAGNRRARLLAQYGLTPKEFDETFLAQGSRCASCGTAEPKGHGWYVDHCHESGAVRGILCSTCNSGIGLLGDNYDGVIRAALYLANHERRERIKLVS